MYYLSLLHLYCNSIALFCSSIPTSFKCFFVLVYVIFVQYSKFKRCSKNIRDRLKIEITQTWQYNYIDKYVASSTSPETPTCELPSDVLRKLRADFVCSDSVIEISLLQVCTGETSI